MDVLPRGGVTKAARKGQLRPVLRQDHPLGLKDDISAFLYVELLGLGVDQDIQVRVVVVGPVSRAGNALGVVEAQRPVGLRGGQVGEEGHVEVAWEDRRGNEGAELDLVQLNGDDYAP